MMQSFDDELPARKYDNFQFVCFNAAIKEAIAANADPSVNCETKYLNVMSHTL